ncbi:RmlC-like cupin domain-containing protein, partial [Chytridium lagenaria]
LITALYAEMGDKGIHEMDKVNVDRVKHLMASYVSNKQDWEKFAHFDPRKYTRNLVDDGNGKFNLMVLCWPENQSSAIHDHAGSHCLMKVLDGEILETQYHWPESSGGPMNLKKATIHTENRVAYIHDKIGLHRGSGKCLFYSEHGNIVSHIPASHSTSSCSSAEAPITLVTGGAHMIAQTHGASHLTNMVVQ